MPLCCDALVQSRSPAADWPHLCLRGDDWEQRGGRGAADERRAAVAAGDVTRRRPGTQTNFGASTRDASALPHRVSSLCSQAHMQAREMPFTRAGCCCLLPLGGSRRRRLHGCCSAICAQPVAVPYIAPPPPAPPACCRDRLSSVRRPASTLLTHPARTSSSTDRIDCCSAHERAMRDGEEHIG